MYEKVLPYQYHMAFVNGKEKNVFDDTRYEVYQSNGQFRAFKAGGVWIKYKI